jgi:hypothetical protein
MHTETKLAMVINFTASGVQRLMYTLRTILHLKRVDENGYFYVKRAIQFCIITSDHMLSSYL